MTIYNDDLFRKQFPEFASEIKYPEPILSMYWDTASMFVSADDCPYNVLAGKRLAVILNYVTAHLLTIGLQAADAAKTGGGQSSMGGFTTSASIGEVSVSKLAPPAADGWQWWLASTSYGQSLWAMLEVLAVGGMSIGGLPERQSFRKSGGIFW